jgi:hypothetical protein
MLLDSLRVLALGNQQRCTRVAEVVDAKRSGEASRAQARAPTLADGSSSDEEDRRRER